MFLGAPQIYAFRKPFKPLIRMKRPAAARKKPAMAKRPAAAGEDGRPESRRSLEFRAAQAEEEVVRMMDERLRMSMFMRQFMNYMAIQGDPLPAGARPAREIQR